MTTKKNNRAYTFLPELINTRHDLNHNEHFFRAITHTFGQCNTPTIWRDIDLLFDCMDSCVWCTKQRSKYVSGIDVYIVSYIEQQPPFAHASNLATTRLSQQHTRECNRYGIASKRNGNRLQGVRDSSCGPTTHAHSSVIEGIDVYLCRCESDRKHPTTIVVCIRYTALP